MGLFDHVNFEMPCPRCGALCRNWQSKDGDCLLKRVEIEDIDNMHTLCVCGQWIEMTRTPPPPAPSQRSAPATLADAQAIGFRWLGEGLTIEFMRAAKRHPLQRVVRTRCDGN